MRDCTVKIDNNGKVTVTQPIEYIEEHSATQLVITLNSELKDSSVSYYTLCFKPGAALKNPPDIKITSDMISASQTSNGIIRYTLPSELTCFGSLDVQVQAHIIDSNGRMVSLIKSPVFRLYFEPSVTGDEEILIGEGEGFISLIHSALAQLNLTVEEVEELCDKLNEAFENGELNGPVIMPSVSTDGTLSWSNDAGLENPPPVNIKGPKGDKGDKGDKGEDGVFSDELADEITLNTAARHTHANKELLDSLTESMIGTLNVYHELPETANDGEICVYSRANVLSAEDSGKLIHIDWNVFNQTIAKDFAQFTITFLNASEEVGYIYATSWSGVNGGYDTIFEYAKGNEQWSVNFIGGVFDKENSYYTNDETTVYLDTPPASFTLPYFSELISDLSNINGDILYAPIKIMIYRDGWYEFEATTGGVTHSEMTEYVTAAINGSLDEIEAMIDESGVLDE